jgi:hypothetical protein
VSVIASCRTDDAARGAGKEGQAGPVAAARLQVPALAVHHVEAPGLNIDELTIRLRDAVDQSSGAPCVDETAVRQELAACTEAPCPDAVARQYRDATYIVDGSVSRVGDAMLATVRVQKGVEEVARATASDPDARIAIANAGTEVGARMRKLLVSAGAEALPLVDPAVSGHDTTPSAPDPTQALPDASATERGDQ